jgi:UDP-2,3-diacylglucosamine pyrophosphatase LpxH
MENHYKTIVLSDIHLGSKYSKAKEVVRFLKKNTCDRLILNGDIIDGWQLRKGGEWKKRHTRFFRTVLKMMEKDKTEVIYLRGNHDDFLGTHLGAYGNVTLQRHAFHTTADGRRILVIHGHELDTVVQNIRWLALLGDLGYQFLLALNPIVNLFRRVFGFGYWSLSKYVKSRVKDAVSFIGAYEQAIVRYAGKYNVSGVMCGHIHTPAMRRIGPIGYYNCGDWVESCSAIVEHHDGRLELLNDLRPLPQPQARALPLPRFRSAPPLPAYDTQSPS